MSHLLAAQVRVHHIGGEGEASGFCRQSYIVRGLRSMLLQLDLAAANLAFLLHGKMKEAMHLGNVA